ncbi:unnamed protein product [Boreogadus saida]
MNHLSVDCDSLATPKHHPVLSLTWTSKPDELGMSCIRIQSHIYFIMLDLFSSASRSFFISMFSVLLQLIQGSPQGPYV